MPTISDEGRELFDLVIEVAHEENAFQYLVTNSWLFFAFFFCWFYIGVWSKLWAQFSPFEK